MRLVETFWKNMCFIACMPPEKSYAGQEATVRNGHGTTDWFHIGKGCILSPCLFNLYAE